MRMRDAIKGREWTLPKGLRAANPDFKVEWCLRIIEQLDHTADLVAEIEEAMGDTVVIGTTRFGIEVFFETEEEMLQLVLALPPMKFN